MDAEEIRLYHLLRDRAPSTAEPIADRLPVRWRLAGAAQQAWHGCRYVGPLLTAEDVLRRIRRYAEGQPASQEELRAVAERVLAERDAIDTSQLCMIDDEPQHWSDEPDPEEAAPAHFGFCSLHRCVRLALAGQETAARQAAQDAMRLILAWLGHFSEPGGAAEVVRRWRIVVARRYPARDGDVPVPLDALTRPQRDDYPEACQPKLTVRAEVAALLLLLRSALKEDDYQALCEVDRWVRGLSVTPRDLVRQEVRLRACADDAVAASQTQALEENRLVDRWWALDAVAALARAGAADDEPEQHLWFVRSFWASSKVLIPRFQPEVLNRGIWRVLASACPPGTPPDSDVPIPAHLMPLGTPLPDPHGQPSGTVGRHTASRTGKSS